MTRARDLAKGTFSGDLTVDTNTLVVDSANNRVGVGTASPTEEIHGYSSGGDFSLKLESASATGTAYTYYKNADRQWATGIRGSVGDSYQIIDSNADTARLVIDTAGAVTMPYQPAFLAIPAISQDNIAINTNVDIAFGTEIFDQNSDFASSVFTAPVDGKYFFACGVSVENLDSAAPFYEIYLKTSNRNISFTMDPDFGQDAAYWTFSHSVLHTMDAGDTCKVQIYQGYGTSQTDIRVTSCFSGYLVA